jgi:hypothetical protein
MWQREGEPVLIRFSDLKVAGFERIRVPAGKSKGEDPGV